MTSAIPVQCSTNWANKPTGSWSMNTVWFEPMTSAMPVPPSTNWANKPSSSKSSKSSFKIFIHLDVFCFTQTTKHQRTRNLSLFFTTFMANLSTALSDSCSPWSFSPNAGFQTSFSHGIPEQQSRRWPGPGPDSSQHLKLGH